MLPDRVSNPGPLTYEALKTQLCCCVNKGKHFQTFEYATSMRFTKFENLTFSPFLPYRLITLFLIGIF